MPDKNQEGINPLAGKVVTDVPKKQVAAIGKAIESDMQAYSAESAVQENRAYKEASELIVNS